MSQIRALRESIQEQPGAGDRRKIFPRGGRTLVTFNTEADINVTLQHLNLGGVQSESVKD
jgi:hypothetical protein